MRNLKYRNLNTDHAQQNINKTVKGLQSVPLAHPSNLLALPTLGAHQPVLGPTWSPTGQPR